MISARVLSTLKIPKLASYCVKSVPSLWHKPTRRFSTATAAQQGKNINIRLMSLDDIKMIKGWAVQEGWNPGKQDAEALYHADPNGYKLLEVDHEPVASLASIRYSRDFVFLGLYMVKPEHRGKGYGKLLWDMTLGTLTNFKSIGLYGVPQQVERYKKSGFVTAHSNTRWKRYNSSRLLTDIDHKQVSDIDLQSKDNFSFAKLDDYDAGIFSTPREAFLSKWLKMPNSFMLGAISNGILRGYGSISLCEEGYRVAPLFADSEAIAQKLYAALCHQVKQENVIFLDSCDANPFSNSFTRNLSLEKVSENFAMYKGETPKAAYSKTFGITSLDIG